MKNFLFILSALFLLVIGQPQFVPFFSFAPTLFAYALFFIAIYALSPAKRFLFGTLFFTCYQISSLWWLTSHPFSYAYGLLLVLSIIFGLQFGIVCLFASEKNFRSPALLLIPAVATLFEWGRLFYFSGYALHPIGLPAASFFLTQPLAAYIGILGLTFITLLCNSFIVFTFLVRTFKPIITLVSALILVYTLHVMVIGGLKKESDAHDLPFRVLVLHVKELPEELDISSRTGLIESSLSDWKKAAELLAHVHKKSYDFILFPEIFVPFPATSPLFSLDQVSTVLKPFDVKPSEELASKNGTLLFSSEDIASIISSVLEIPVVIGLEGVERDEILGKNLYFNSCFFIAKNPGRYDKMVLLPMGEYIPGSWAKGLAARYGLFDSFTKGDGVKVFETSRLKIAPTICYEDTFSYISRKAALLGADVLVNLTNDAWYPDSALGRVHAAHSRVRSIETGLPMIRSCNFGVSGAYDALGNPVKEVSFTDMKAPMELFDVAVPSFSYKAPYRYVGDLPLVIFSLAVILYFILRSKYAKKV